MPLEPKHSDETPQAEIASTIRELIDSFGVTEVATVLRQERLLSRDGFDDMGQHMLRAYTLILLDSRHTRATAQIVARLCYLDTAAGKETTQEEIGRENGISKQAVCNMEADIAERLGLPRRSSPQAREAHRAMNRRNPNAAISA